MSKRQPDKAKDIEQYKAELDNIDAIAAPAIKQALEQAERGVLIAKDGRRMSARQVANLKAGHALTEIDAHKAREIHGKGGKASAEVQRQRRTIREIYSDLLSQPDTITTDNAGELADVAQSMAQARGQSLTVYDAIAVAMAARAKAGDVRAAAFVRDSAGDKPADNLEVTGDVMTPGDRALMAKLAHQMGLDGTIVHNSGRLNSDNAKNDDDTSITISEN